jgi:hypothetical protein
MKQSDLSGTRRKGSRLVCRTLRPFFDRLSSVCDTHTNEKLLTNLKVDDRRVCRGFEDAAPFKARTGLLTGRLEMKSFIECFCRKIDPMRRASHLRARRSMNRTIPGLVAND